MELTPETLFIKVAVSHALQPDTTVLIREKI